MWVFFDESGDFEFQASGYDCYALAALTCPDKLIGPMGEFVSRCKANWRVDELHATELSPAQVLDIAQFLEGSGLALVATVTDTEMVTRSHIAQYRLAQSAQTQSNLDWYRRESTKAIGSPL